MDAGVGGVGGGWEGTDEDGGVGAGDAFSGGKQSRRQPGRRGVFGFGERAAGRLDGVGADGGFDDHGGLQRGFVCVSDRAERDAGGADESAGGGGERLWGVGLGDEHHVERRGKHEHPERNDRSG